MKKKLLKFSAELFMIIAVIFCFTSCAYFIENTLVHIEDWFYEISEENSERCAHIYSEPQRENESPSTCLEEGYYELAVYCTECGKELGRLGKISEMSGHIEVLHKAKEPTCDEVGWDEYATCERDGCEYTTYVEKAPVGHTFGEWGGNTATCTEGGIETRKCERLGCNHSEIRDTDALGHSYGELFGTPATCENRGIEYSECERSGCSEIKTIVTEALGHIEVIQEAKNRSCTEVGWDEYTTCDRHNVYGASRPGS